MLPEEIGTPVQVRDRSRGLGGDEIGRFDERRRGFCSDCTSAVDVGLIADAKTRGQQTVTEETYASMAIRGARLRSASGWRLMI